MSSHEIKQVRELLAYQPDQKTMSLAESRVNFDQQGQQLPLPDGVTIEATIAGGVPAQWFRAKNVHTDAAMLYLHGGGYMVGSSTSHRHLIAVLGEAASVAVLAPDYRLGPEHPFPAAVEDAVSAYRHLTQSGIAPDRILIAGDSAGGGLTVATMVALRDRQLPLPAAGVCLSPWADLTNTAESYTTRAAVDPILSRERLDEMAAAYLQGQDARLPLASPVFADLTGLPPLLIQVGTDEVLFDDATRLDARAKAAGIEVRLEAWEEMIHVWHYFYPLLAEGREAIARVGEFVRARINAPVT
ncbi:MAG: alpha/beta hydrolase [Blastocatellia bacterium]